MTSDIYITASCIISNNVVYKNEERIFGNQEADLPDFLLSVYRHVDVKYPRFYKMDGLSKLGWVATEILLKDSFRTAQYQPEDVGVVFANANSCLDTDLKYYETTKEMASPALFVYTLPNIVTGEICISHNFKGETGFFIMREFDAGFIEQYVSNLFINNILQVCICGWVDLLDEQYKTVLFLVEKVKKGVSIPFTIENINKTYQLENG